MAYTTNINLLQRANTSAAIGVIRTTIGPGVVVGDRQKFSIQFVRTSGTAGVAKCTVQVSNDGSNYITYNRLVSNISAGTKFTTVNLDAAGNSTQIVFFDIGDTFAYIRVYLNYNNADGIISAILQNNVPGI